MEESKTSLETDRPDQSTITESSVSFVAEDKSSVLNLNLRKDPRAIWFRERILASINMQDDQLFYSMMDSEARQNFSKFVTASLLPNELSLDKRTFYVSKIIVDKLIYEDKDFTEWRLIPPPPPPPPSPPKPKKGKKGKKAEPEPELKAEESKDLAKTRSIKSVQKIKSSKSIRSSKSRDTEIEEEPVEPDEPEAAVADVSSIQSDDENAMSQYNLEEEEPQIIAKDDYYFPPPPEDLDPEVDGTLEYYTITRAVPRVIQYPKLIPVFGAFTPQVTRRDRRYIYFVRQTQDGIPLADTDEITKLKMPEYILTGVTSGKVLTSLGLHLKDAFIPLFKKQFREVSIGSAGDGDANQVMLARQASYAGQHHKIEETSSQVNYLRPSDYRKMSNIARGENAERRATGIIAKSLQRYCEKYKKKPPHTQ